ncbi:MAG: hypothetical protein KKA60_12865 [Proteobacteria bacterium]|nr:hypothetical protein [Pseudomonadota bacterium]
MNRAIRPHGLIALALFLALAAPVAARDGEPVRVAVENGRVSVDARGRTAGQVFAALSEATGVFSWVAGPAREEKLSARVTDLPMDKAVEALVPGRYALSFTGNRVTAVYVLSQGADAAPETERVTRLAYGKFFSPDELSGLVTAHVAKSRPRARLFTRLSREDVAGRRAAWAFVFYDGPGQVPALEEVRRRVREAWTAREAAGPAGSVAQMPPPLPGRFFTLETSADFSGPPVRTFREGLPDEFSLETPAASLLAAKLPDQGPFTLVRAYSMDILATGFEFRAADGKPLYVDLARKAVYTGFSAPAKTEPEPEPSPELRREVLAQWTEFLDS